MMQQDQLQDVVETYLKQRRFELAARALSKAPGEWTPALLARFLSELLLRKQYRLAVTWIQRLQSTEAKQALGAAAQNYEELCWTPSALVKRMVTAGDLDDALKFIKEIGLQGDFDVKALIDGMLSRAQYKRGLDHIKQFQLERQFSTLELMNGMLQANDWEVAIKFANEVPALWDHFPKEEVVKRMITARDWPSAVSYIKTFNLSEDKSNSSVIVALVRAQIASSELYKAMKNVIKYKIEGVFSPKNLIQTMIDCKQHEHAIRFMKMLHLEQEFQSEMPRIHSDRIADVKAFRLRMKRRREEAQQRFGFKLSTSLRINEGPLHCPISQGEIVDEKLWFSDGKSSYVESIPPLKEEPELALHKKDQNEVKHEDDPFDSGEEILMLKTGSSIGLGGLSSPRLPSFDDDDDDVGSLNRMLLGGRPLANEQKTSFDMSSPILRAQAPASAPAPIRGNEETHAHPPPRLYAPVQSTPSLFPPPRTSQPQRSMKASDFLKSLAAPNQASTSSQVMEAVGRSSQPRTRLPQSALIPPTFIQYPSPASFGHAALQQQQPQNIQAHQQHPPPSWFMQRTNQNNSATETRQDPQPQLEPPFFE